MVEAVVPAIEEELRSELRFHLPPGERVSALSERETTAITLSRMDIGHVEGLVAAQHHQEERRRRRSGSAPARLAAMLQDVAVPSPSVVDFDLSGEQSDAESSEMSVSDMTAEQRAAYWARMSHLSRTVDNICIDADGNLTYDEKQMRVEDDHSEASSDDGLPSHPLGFVPPHIFAPRRTSSSPSSSDDGLPAHPLGFVPPHIAPRPRTSSSSSEASSDDGLPSHPHGFVPHEHSSADRMIDAIDALHTIPNDSAADFLEFLLRYLPNLVGDWEIVFSNISEKIQVVENMWERISSPSCVAEGDCVAGGLQGCIAVAGGGLKEDEDGMKKGDEDDTASTATPDSRSRLSSICSFSTRSRHDSFSSTDLSPAGDESSWPFGSAGSSSPPSSSTFGSGSSSSRPRWLSPSRTQEGSSWPGELGGTTELGGLGAVVEEDATRGSSVYDEEDKRSRLPEKTRGTRTSTLSSLNDASTSCSFLLNLELLELRGSSLEEVHGFLMRFLPQQQAYVQGRRTNLEKRLAKIEALAMGLVV